MAATSYAALVSLIHTIDHVLEHGRNSFALNHEQVQSIQEQTAYLVEFLERYSNGYSKEVEALEGQIADASHAAEDLIESKVVDYIHDHGSTVFDESKSITFCQRLQGVIEGMDLIKKKAMEIEEKRDIKFTLPKSSISSSSSSSSLPAGKDTMVGFDDFLKQIMERLTLQRSERLTIITVSGMGGIGKTTLARNVYGNPYIVKHFDIRGWVTISQQYEIKEILSILLIEFEVLTKETSSKMNESQLGEKLHKHLFGRRYLIVMDDMWSTDAWDRVRLFFPENENGSGIIITTRLSSMANQLGSWGLEVDFLDEEQSWNLLRGKVFGQKECTPELEEIGKKIAKNCKGYPLSIVVIAGLLAKSNMTREHWDHVANEVNSIVTLADDGHCSKILSLSYKNLPVHLKPCFLYMGVFPEDHKIKVSRLISLWVAEGFVKPNKYKSLEDVAEELLADLINRNLIMVDKRRLSGGVKICKVHDLLRDLCIMQAEKENFICVIRGRDFDVSQALENQRHIVVEERKHELIQPTSLLRSITFKTSLVISSSDKSTSPFSFGGRLIRALNGNLDCFVVDILDDLVNLRYVNLTLMISCPLPVSRPLLWNLQTLILIVRDDDLTTVAPREIWEMKQLRHLNIRYKATDRRYGKHEGFVYLPEPSSNGSTMKHIQSLKGVFNLTFSEPVVERIQNIKELKISYRDKEKDYCLSNIQHLHKLELLRIVFEFPFWEKDYLSVEKLFFPQSLRELVLCGSHIPWEHMAILECLPNLQVLQLMSNAFVGEEWNPIEGHFNSLKCLLIFYCNELKVWNAENIHFPVLEHLYLCCLNNLEEIPLGLGEITTLQLIKLLYCSDSAAISAIDILDEQQSLGNDELQVEIWLDKDSTQLDNLESRDNLKVGYNA